MMTRNFCDDETGTRDVTKDGDGEDGWSLSAGRKRKSEQSDEDASCPMGK